MSIRKKRQLFIAGGAVLAVLIAAIMLVIALGGHGRDAGTGGGSYQKHFDAAEAAYNRRDYGTALSELDKAMELDETEECYLLMAEIYYAQGDVDHARRVLLSGYSNVGGSVLEERLDQLNGTSGGTAQPAAASVTVGGRTFPADTSSVVLSNRGLQNSDLEALCTLTNLENLSISDNAITDVSPIANLPKLTSLQLSNNNVTDVSPLSGLESLKTLYLDGNPVDDLTPLYQLQNLRTLSMKSVSVTDRELTALEEALPDCYIFSDTREEEVPEQLSLGGKTFYSNTKELDLSGLGLRDISELRKCTQLEKLDLRDNEISDLSPLSELENLEKLNLWNNRVRDLNALSNLTRLRSLDLDSNRFTDIAPLENLTMLEELWLNGNDLDSLEPLKSLSGLRRLGLKSAGLQDSDLDVLSGLTTLEELALEDNEDISPEKMEDLEKALDGCVITHSDLLWTVELGGKSFTSDATEISVPGQGVTDLSGLEHFTELVTLNLDDNDVTDLTPLYELAKLRTVSLRGNARLAPEELATLRGHLPDCEILADDGQEPEPSPEPSAGPEPENYAKGSQAALDALSSDGSFAILTASGSDDAAAMREGFLASAVDCNLKVVYDMTCPQDTEDFTPYITAIRDTGAGTVFLVLDDTAYGLFTVEANAMRFTAKLVQIK